MSMHAPFRELEEPSVVLITGNMAAGKSSVAQALARHVIVGPELNEVIALYRGLPLRVFVLQPSPAVLAAREAARSKSGYANAEDILRFDALLRSGTPRHGHWLDSSELSVEQTADEAQRHWATALVSP